MRVCEGWALWTVCTEDRGDKARWRSKEYGTGHRTLRHPNPPLAAGIPRSLSIERGPGWIRVVLLSSGPGWTGVGRGAGVVPVFGLFRLWTFLGLSVVQSTNASAQQTHREGRTEECEYQMNDWWSLYNCKHMGRDRPILITIFLAKSKHWFWNFYKTIAWGFGDDSAEQLKLRFTLIGLSLFWLEQLTQIAKFISAK
jgi:hypothetical protein